MLERDRVEEIDHLESERFSVKPINRSNVEQLVKSRERVITKLEQNFDEHIPMNNDGELPVMFVRLERVTEDWREDICDSLFGNVHAVVSYRRTSISAKILRSVLPIQSEPQGHLVCNLLP